MVPVLSTYCPFYRYHFIAVHFLFYLILIMISVEELIDIALDLCHRIFLISRLADWFLRLLNWLRRH